MDEQTRNLLLAFALSFLVIVGWYALFPPPPPQPTQSPIAESEVLPPATSADAPTAEAATPAAAAPRISVTSPRLAGSISLLGGRIDDLSLRDYFESTAPGADNVHLFNPVGGPRAPFYAIFGWTPRGALTDDAVPGPNTLWEPVGTTTLTPESPLTIRWDNGQGLVFTRTIAVDANFMFTVTDRVENFSDQTVELSSWGILAQHGLPEGLENFFISHEGLVLMADGRLTEDSFKTMRGYRISERERTPAKEVEIEANGWIGLTTKYFMGTLVGIPGQRFTAVAQYVPGVDIYQVSIRQPVVSVPPGGSAEAQSMLYAGAKEWATLRAYQNNLGIERFVDAIDWGWFFFLTKPIFIALHFLNAWIGNMGWAIMTLTLVIKAIVLPLAWKSYVSMARMKELQPEMLAIKERAGDDRQKLQQEMLRLYREKKVNPAAGCLPIFLQIPIFFALYKVIFVTIELRHAPWIWVFDDLSAPDPTSIINLFGLLPWDAPPPGSLLSLIFVGILPIAFGATMWLQMRLNPVPTDPVQATVFNWMPWIFMFILGGFASGLLLYWIWNNILTFCQQYLIMRMHGTKPDVLGNIFGERWNRLRRPRGETK